MMTISADAKVTGQIVVPLPSHQTARGFVPQAEGAYYVGGSHGGPVVGTHADSDTLDPTSAFWIARIESDGSVGWQNFYGEYRSVGQALSQSTAGRLALAGFYNNPDPGKHLDGRYIVVEPDGTLIADHNFGPSGRNQFHQILATSDGGFLAMGYRQTEPTHRAWLVRIDPDGNPLWERLAERDNNVTINAGIALEGDGGLFVGGNGEGAWMLRTDAWGNDTVERSGECYMKTISDCDDGNPCTLDDCTYSACSNSDAVEAGVCNDNDPCTSDLCEPSIGCFTKAVAGCQ